MAEGGAPEAREKRDVTRGRIDVDQRPVTVTSVGSLTSKTVPGCFVIAGMTAFFAPASESLPHTTDRPPERNSVTS